MKPTISRTWGVAALSAAALLAACSSDHTASGSGSAPSGTPVPAQPATQAFSAFAENIFAAPANSTPVAVEGVNLVFDVDNDPMAFMALLM